MYNMREKNSRRNHMKTYPVSEKFKREFVKKMDDHNSSTDITKAGIFDLLDATSGIDNSKFTKEDSLKELQRRGI